MKKKLPLIIGIILFVIIIVVCIILGMPKKEKLNNEFEFLEPILYIKNHAILTTNTDLKRLNENYENILQRNGLEESDINIYIKEEYIQKDNIYYAKFISTYQDQYRVAFNLNTNEIAFKKITE